MGSAAAPKIIFYTNNGCPWAQRALITLQELKLEYETVIIDLGTPRTPEYLKINPRGLVPALDYNGTIITESLTVTQFLADAHPSHLEKTSSEEGGALQRAKINFFVDTYINKVLSSLFATLRAEGEEKEKQATLMVDAVIKEIEPLLQDAKPFFGGASRITLAEALTASFILRTLSFGKHEDLFPGSTLTSLEQKAPAFWKWANAVVQEKSVNAFWDEDVYVEKMRERMAKAKV